MKKTVLSLLLLTISMGTLESVAQQTTSVARPNNIRSGFYMKFGPSFPVTPFNGVQIDGARVFEPAKTGFFGDFGYLIYLGPAFAKNYLRAGIDVTFLTAGFHASDHVYQNDESWVDYYYFFAGQKIGPVITVNPVDKLMIDLSWKLGFYAAEYNDDWGMDLTQQEISVGIRYRIVAFSVNYHFGDINFNDFDKTNPERWANTNAVKIMVGLKF